MLSVENIYFSDHNALRVAIVKNAVEVQKFNKI